MKGSKGDILVVGSVALDSVKTADGESREALGGSAVYFSLAARHFAPVSLVGVVGSDFPKEHREMLASRGIDLSGLEEAPGKTFRWTGSYEKDLNAAETMDTRLNVFESFKPKLTDMHKKAAVLFLANIDPDLQLEVLSQMKDPDCVALDSMNLWISIKLPSLKKLLGKVDIFFVNDEEAKALSGEKNIMKAASVISGWGPGIVIVKKGEHGSVMKAGDRYFAFPAYPLETVKDPTGAGDSFAGAFMGSLLQSGGFKDIAQLKRSLLYGTVAASFNVEDFSTARSESIRRGDLEARLDDFIELLKVPQGEAVGSLN